MKLTALPLAGIALAVEAGNHKNPGRFDLVEQAIRKARHWGASAASMNGRKSQGKICNELDGVFDRFHEAARKRYADLCIPLLGVVELCLRFTRPYNA